MSLGHVYRTFVNNNNLDIISYANVSDKDLQVKPIISNIELGKNNTAKIKFQKYFYSPNNIKTDNNKVVTVKYVFDRKPENEAQYNINPYGIKFIYYE